MPGKPPVAFLKEHLEALGHPAIVAPESFYLRGFDSTLDRWFGNKRWRKKGERFTLLATNERGGWYSAWWYSDLGDRRPPVVFMGTTRTKGLSVIADSTIDFIEIVCSGMYWDHDASAFVSHDGVDAAKLAAFAALARDDYALAMRSPMAITLDARAKHPNFATWVSRHAG